MNSSSRPLILRSNRFLGSSLLERDLITNEVLEEANEKLLESIQSGDSVNASLLNTLLFDMNALDEGKLIESIVETEHIGAIDLDHYDLSNAAKIGFDLDLALATYTIPFDRVEDFTMIATGYYLSRPAVQHWQELIDGHIIWYVSTVASIVNAVESVRAALDEAQAAEEAKAQEEAAKAQKEAARKANA